MSAKTSHSKAIKLALRGSADGCDESFVNWESELFEHTSLAFDDQQLAMGVDGGSEIAPGLALAHEEGLRVDSYVASIVDLADKGHTTARKGQFEPPARIAIGAQVKLGWHLKQLVAVQLQPLPRIARGIVSTCRARWGLAKW